MGINVGITEFTLAVLTTNEDMKYGGGCPIFYAKTNDELQKKAMLMAKSVGGMVHQLEPETLIIVKH